jgi:outer membrane protein assembly factor BamB
MIIAAWLLFRRRTPGQPRGRLRTSALLAGLLLGVFLFVTMCGLLAWSRLGLRAKWNELVRGDEADAALLADLQNDDFAPPPAAGRPGEWPQWRGPNRDGVSQEGNLRLDWNARSPKVLWRHAIGQGYTSPIVSAGRLYVQDKAGDKERIICLKAENGQPVWMHEYPTDYEGLMSHERGPRATPTVHDGRLYAVGTRGQFLCLEATEDTTRAMVLWEHDLLTKFDARLPAWGIACSPLVEENLVIVQPGGEKGSIAAFDRLTGKSAWTALDEPAGYSSPVAATLAGVRQIVCFTGEGLVGLQPADGKQLWYFPWKTSYSANVATPVIAGNNVFISSGYNTGCALVRVTRQGDAWTASAAYLKRNKLMRNHQSTCVLHRGFLFGFDSRGSDERGVVLRCFDVRTGEERWASSDLGKGVPLLVDGQLLVLLSTGTLLLVEATPDAYREKARFEAFSDSEVWALPALANGRLYLRSHREVICVEVGK